MKKLRVLVVDDAAVVRKLIADILSAEPDMEVTVAANGRIALERLEQATQDAVTLDIEMPELNGLETLAIIRQKYPRLPVIMFSTLTERGAAATLDALAAGANDYATKPTKSGSLLTAMDQIRGMLVPKIRALCNKEAPPEVSAQPSVPVPVARRPVLRPLVAGTPQVVAVGVSTGGPNALSTLVCQLGAPLPVPMVIVQHMPPVFTRLLAERLASKSGLDVREATAGEPLLPEKIYLAPGDFHMEVARNGVGRLLKLQQGPPENSCRPAVDVLFRSLVPVYGPNVLAIVLTGMGQDGLRGAQEIREAGGTVLAQDEATSVVWGMPGAVVRAGVAQQVLPLEEIAGEIGRRVRGRH